jgi:hypothetical protein
MSEQVELRLTILQLRAHAAHLEFRLAHATSFRYAPFTARCNAGKWIVNSDDGSTHVEFVGEDAQDEAIREAARRAAATIR